MTRKETKNEAARVTPYADDRAKTAQIGSMFDSIAERYDALNRVISLGLDRRWRRRAIQMLSRRRPGRALDVATGTGDMIVDLHRMLDVDEVTGLDLSAGMLSLARGRVTKEAPDAQVTLVQGDCASMPFDDDRFDLVTAVFGVRNFEALEESLAEMRRVLAPGGECLVLEFSRPRGALFRLGFWTYFRTFVPLVGRVLSADPAAYRYLPRSVAMFPSPGAFRTMLEDAGFGDVTVRPMSNGICTVYLASPTTSS